MVADTTEIKYERKVYDYVHNPREDYFEALGRWLHDANTWYSVSASFPYMFMTNQLIPTVDQNGFVHHLGTQCPTPFGFLNNPRPEPPGLGLPNARPNPQGPEHLPPLFRGQPTRRQRATARRNTEGVRCRIAPIWKRFVAEFLDFLILFFLKLAATFVAIDFFDFINLDKYDVELFTHALDYKSFMELTSEIVVLEIIHRVVVCIFEVFWLHHGTHGRIGGATPGKALMGLRVIRCDVAVNLPDRPSDVVIVTPGANLGLYRAIARAVLKNFVLSVLFPLCVFLMFFKHNQTAYDVLSKSIVVEADTNRERP